MSIASLSQLLMLYGWFALAAVLLLMLLIARFYTHFSGEKTYFRLFLIPVVGFGAATVRYASIDIIAGDLAGDIVMTISGAILIGLSIVIYRKMVMGRERL